MSEDVSRPTRIERTFYPDGSPMEETHYRGESCHGPWRKWHPNGVLALEYFYEKHVFADGTHRQWYPNGQLQSEFTCRNGERIREIAFNSKGKQVPTAFERLQIRQRKLFMRAAAKAHKARPLKRLKSIDSAEAARSQEHIRSLLSINTAPARAWLAESTESSPRNLGELDTPLSLYFIDLLLELGAAEVLAVEVSSSPYDSIQSTNHIVVKLPAEPASRARVFSFTASISHDLGFGIEGDWGQDYVYMMLC